MRDAVIVEAVRTPVGKRNGGLSGVHPVSLSAHVLKSLASRSGVDPAVVDDVIWGCVGQVGEQTFDIGRNAVLAAGWPETVTGVTVDRQCGSSQQSVHFAAAGLIAGELPSQRFFLSVSDVMSSAMALSTPLASRRMGTMRR